MLGAEVRLPRMHVRGLPVPFAQATTNRRGEYRLPALPPGGYRLALLPQYEVSRETFELAPGERKHLGALQVQKSR